MRILTLKENDPCLEYSENPEYLRKLMQEITVKVKVDGFGKHFIDDEQNRLILRVFIRRNNTTISFKFGMSLNDTQVFVNGFETGVMNEDEESRIFNDLLYSILASVASDYYIPNDYIDFISEFGYEDNSDTKKRYRKCAEHSAKLHKIFTEEDIESLPT